MRQAIKRTLNRVSGVAGAALLLSALAGSARAQLPGTQAYYTDPWRPDPGVAVATVGPETISEADVYVWQLMVGADALVVKDWGEAEPGTNDAQLLALERAVRQMLEYRLLAETPEARQGLGDSAAEKGARTYFDAVSEWLFADEIVAPKLRIDEADVALYYRTNIATGAETGTGAFGAAPARLVVRRLRVPYDQPVSEDSRARARQTAGFLSAQAQRRGGLRPLLEINPQFVVDPLPEGSREITVGQREINPLVEQVALGLEEGEVSRPVSLPDAVVLVELVSRIENPAPSIEEVAPEIRRILRKGLIWSQTSYRLGEEFRNARPINRVHLLPFMSGDTELYRVRDFRMTNEEFADFAPEIAALVMNEGTVPLPVVGVVADWVRGEVLNQTVERSGVAAGDPRFAAARVMADDLVLGTQALRVLRAQVKPTTEEVAAYALENRDALYPPTQKGIWRMTLAPQESAALSAAEQARLAALMELYLRGLLQDAKRLLAERAELTGPGAFLVPQAVVDRLPQPPDDRYRRTMEFVADLDPRAAREQLGFDVAGLTPGQFSEPLRRPDGSFTVYYVASEVQRPAPAPKALEALARRELVQERARGAALEELADMEIEGRLRFNFPTAGISLANMTAE
ncbi:MAG: hypothetical protein RLY93_17220 [Sumerlaeia bacterium]